MPKKKTKKKKTNGSVGGKAEIGRASCRERV